MMAKKMTARSKAKGAPRKAAAGRKTGAPKRPSTARGGGSQARARGSKAKPAPPRPSGKRAAAGAAKPRTAPKPQGSKASAAGKPAGQAGRAARTKGAASKGAAPKGAAPAKGTAPKGAPQAKGAAPKAASHAKGAASGQAGLKSVAGSVGPAHRTAPAAPKGAAAPAKRARAPHGPITPVSDHAPEPRGRGAGARGAGGGSAFDPRSRGLGSAVQFARSVAARDSATLRPRDTSPPKPAARVRPRPARAEGAAEPALDPQELKEIRDSLLAMRRELHATIQKTWRSGMETRDEAFSEMGDFVTASVEKEQMFETGQSGVEMLREVERALDRVDSGTYGLCESCGGRIPNSRLKAIPHARFCLECQEAQERGKAI